MLPHLRIGIIALVVGASSITTPIPLEAAAQNSAQTTLELRRFRFHVDQNDKTWITFRFINSGRRAVIVNAITIDPHGNWVIVAKRVEADAVFKWTMPVTAKPPAVWLDTNQGVSRFDLGG